MVSRVNRPGHHDAIPIDVVGIPAGGWSELGAAAQNLVTAAEVVLGSRRQLDLVAQQSAPAGTATEQIAWPSPLLPALPGLLERCAGRRTVVLASGDPLVSGIGSTLIDLLGPDRVRIHPAVSSVALARAAMGWPSDSVVVVSAVGRNLAAVRRELADRRRIIVLSAGSQTPGELAELLTAAGYGRSQLTVLGNLGAAAESRQQFPAAQLTVLGNFGAAAESRRQQLPAEYLAGGLDSQQSADQRPSFPALNIVAVQCVANETAARLPRIPGLSDEAYDNDGQLTKRDLRASALARLAPTPGEMLWDLGAGAGSIAIEWARSHPSCRAIAVERSAERAARIKQNAAQLGVPGVRVLTMETSAALAALALETQGATTNPPDAIFVGGGLTPELLDQCWSALAPGGRLAAHAVTIETEQILIAAWQSYGGELIRLGVERLEPLGRLHGWQPARPVVQWSATRKAPTQ